jgi:hypothetical protein
MINTGLNLADKLPKFVGTHFVPPATWSGSLENECPS